MTKFFLKTVPDQREAHVYIFVFGGFLSVCKISLFFSCRVFKLCSNQLRKKHFSFTCKNISGNYIKYTHTLVYIYIYIYQIIADYKWIQALSIYNPSSSTKLCIMSHISIVNTLSALFFLLL